MHPAGLVRLGCACYGKLVRSLARTHERRHPGTKFMTSRAILVEFLVRPKDIGRAGELTLENAAASLENELGCLRFNVLKEATEPSRFTLCEVYRNAADFDVHLRSSHFESFSEATRDLFVSQICPATRPEE